MGKLFLLFVYTLISATITAGTISGRVVDENAQPMEFVNVVLLSHNDSAFVQGAVTKDDGTFTIDTDKNEGLLKVSFVGYIIKYVDARQGDMGDIQMQPDDYTLKEVIVKGYHPVIRKEHSKNILDIRQIPRVETMKAMDVMKFAPGVILTAAGEIRMAGMAATVLVNGRRLSGEELSAYLKSLNAMDVEKIEVMQNHGGMNDADISGGVVNIVTKRNMTGFSESTDIYAATPGSKSYLFTPMTNIFFGTDKWNVYGTYSYAQGKSKQYSETTNEYTYNGTRHYSEGEYYGWQKRHTYRVGAVCNLIRHQSVGIEVNGVSAAPTTAHDMKAQTYTIGGTPYGGTAQQAYRSHSDFYNIAGAYNWEFDSGESYMKLLVNYNNKNSLDDNRLETRYKELEGYDVEETDITRTEGDNVSAAVDFKKKLKKGWTVSAGGKLLTSNRSSRVSVEDRQEDTSSVTDWNYRENIYGGYMGATKELGKWYFAGSLRVEKTALKGDADDGGMTRKNYTDWFPYAYVAYTTSKGYNYSLSYNRTIYRPPFALMNGFVNRISDVLYDKGNPELEAELTDVVEFSVSRGRHSGLLKYSHKPNTITEFFEVENGITYHTNKNYGSVSTILADYTYSGYIRSWWMANLSITGSYTRIPDSYNKRHLATGEVSWTNRMSWKSVGTLNLGCYCTTPNIEGNSYTKGYTSFDISLERSFFNDALTIKAGVDDIFNGVKTNTENIVPTLNYNAYIKNQTRPVWCSITYNFSTKTRTGKKRIQNDNNIENRM